MAVTVTVDPRFINRILRGRRATRQVEARTRRVTALAVQGARRHGSMWETVDGKVITGERGLPQGVIIVDHPAARFVLEGTRPHLIRPRRSRGPGARLRFRARSGDLVFTKLVRHPGYRGDNFLLEALRRGR